VSCHEVAIFHNAEVGATRAKLSDTGEAIEDVIPVALGEQLDCSFYDALAPALALRLDAQLYSADRRAHGEWPEVVLLE